MCSDTAEVADEHEKHVRSVEKDAYRQDLYGNVYHDIVQLLLSSRHGNFFPFYSQVQLECMVDHDIATFGFV